MKKICFLGLVCMLLAGCKSVHPVQTGNDSIRIKTEYIYKNRIDTVLVERDQNTETRNDTVFVTKTEYKYQTKYVGDTVILRDTITTAKTFLTVRNELNGWQKFMQAMGYAGMGTFLALLITFVFYIFKKIK